MSKQSFVLNLLRLAPIVLLALAILGCSLDASPSIEPKSPVPSTTEPGQSEGLLSPTPSAPLRTVAESASPETNDQPIWEGCTPPCWLSITPGETPLEEAMDILSSRKDLELVRNVQSWENQNWVTWDFRFTTVAPDVFFEPFTGVKVSGADGIVDAVLITYRHKVSLQHVIDTLGAPEKLVAYLTGGPELMYWQAVLFYPERGAVFEVVVKRISDLEISLIPSSTVFSGSYFQPRSMEELMQPSRLYVPGMHMDEYYREWPGYGSMQVEPELLDKKY